MAPSQACELGISAIPKSGTGRASRVYLHASPGGLSFAVQEPEESRCRDDDDMPTGNPGHNGDRKTGGPQPPWAANSRPIVVVNVEMTLGIRARGVSRQRENTTLCEERLRLEGTSSLRRARDVLHLHPLSSV